MARPDVPMTPAVRALRAARIEFTPRVYAYVERGGTAHAAEALGVDDHAVVKTLVMESRDVAPKPKPLLVVMHGDLEVSTRQLARLLGAKAVAPATETAVEKWTGYVPGGVSPFGTRSALPVYVEETVLGLDRVYINGGKRGFLVGIAPSVLTALLAAVPVRVGIRDGEPPKLTLCGKAASRFAGPAFGCPAAFGLVFASPQGAPASLGAARREAGATATLSVARVGMTMPGASGISSTATTLTT